LREQDGQFFWRDQQLDASGGAGFSPDQSGAFECKHHLMDGRRADAEVALQVGFGGRAAEDAGIGMDESKVLALLGGEAWSGGRGIHVT
jgi:hypothetical protein